MVYIKFGNRKYYATKSGKPRKVTTSYGKTFRTRRGRLGRYKYVNGRRVSFVGARQKYRRRRY